MDRSSPYRSHDLQLVRARLRYAKVKAARQGTAKLCNIRDIIAILQFTFLTEDAGKPTTISRLEHVHSIITEPCAFAMTDPSPYQMRHRLFADWRRQTGQNKEWKTR